jgi:NAD(P)-dependent dehydrogenase (short-subunit alcohol dehydrogenase family)
MEKTIAIVGGASRGAGRGIALALGDSGATVYVAARSSRGGPKPADEAPGTVEDTADQVTARGGRGIPVRVDLGDPEQVAALFRRVAEEQGRLDVLANSAWGPLCMPLWSQPFWDLDQSLWNETINTLNACWLTSTHATRMMIAQKRGLIVHVTDNLSPDPSAYRDQIHWDLGHEFINRLVLNLSRGLKKSKVTVVGLNPGFMRTERVLMHMKTDALKKEFRFDLSESPEYIGRAVVALAADSDVIRKSGELLWVADLAVEYGFTDIDGRRIPRFDPTAPMQAFPC